MSFWKRIAETDEQLDQVSYYELLGVSQDASADEIDEHYYKLAGRLHPDRYVGRCSAEGLNSLNRICARLAQAKKILQTPEQRASYDAGLAQGKNRLEDSSDKPRKLSQQDPATPMARGLYEKAMAELERGAKSAAQAKLKLAKQYEPGSQAIAEALASLEPEKASKPATPAVPAAVAPVEPVEAARVQETDDTSADEEHPSAQQTPALATVLPTKDGTWQRSHARQDVVLPVRLRIPTWERFEVLYTRDISGGGMFLRCAKPMAVDSQILLQLLAPNGETVEIKAKVAHVRAAGEGRAAGMGLRFEEMTLAVTDQLQRLLARKATRCSCALAASSSPNT